MLKETPFRDALAAHRREFPSFAEGTVKLGLPPQQSRGAPDQVLLEVGTSDPSVLARVRKEAPERFVMLRSLWGEEGNLQRLMASGLNATGDGLLLPLPQSLLNQDDIHEQTAALKQRINNLRQEHLVARRDSQAVPLNDCRIWILDRVTKYRIKLLKIKN